MITFEELMKEKTALINAAESSSEGDVLADSINQYLDDVLGYVRERFELLGINWEETK